MAEKKDMTENTVEEAIENNLEPVDALEGETEALEPESEADPQPDEKLTIEADPQPELHEPEETLAQPQEEAPAKKALAPSAIAHWAVHVIMGIIIIVMCFMMFTTTGKLIQEYGWSEGTEISSTYGNHDWEAIGVDLDTYAYYYDMYNQYFALYADEYKAMGINNMRELMDSMYKSMTMYHLDSGADGSDIAIQ